MADGERQVPVAVLCALVPGLPARVAGARDQAAVADDVAGTGEALDAASLQPDREGDHAPDPRDPEQALHVGRGDEHRVQLGGELPGLLATQRRLREQQLHPELHERWQRRGRGHVVLGEQARNRVLHPDLLTDELEPGAQEVAGLTPLGGSHVGLRDQVAAEQLRQGRRVDRVGLHRGVADRLDRRRMGKPEVSTLTGEQVAQPIPVGRGLDHRALGRGPAGQGGEVGDARLPLRGQLDVADGPALGVDRGDGEGPLVAVEAGVEHDVSWRRDAGAYGVQSSRETSNR